MSHEAIELTPLDHLPAFACIVQLFLFPTANPDVALLRSSLTALVTSIPALCGTVGPSTAKPGRWAIGAPFVPPEELFSEQDLPDEDFAVWRSRNFFDLPKSLSPCSQVAIPPAPVLRVRITRVCGGCVLAYCVWHAFSDGPGMAQLLGSWAAACRGIATELNFDRSRLMHGAGRGLLADHPEFVVDEPKPQPPRADPQPVCSYVFWLSGAQVVALKAAAQDPARPDAWVSRNDAVCAFITTSIARARLGVGVDPSTVSTLLLAVDGRNRLVPPMPQRWVGNCTGLALPSAPMSELGDPRTPFAERLRSAARGVRAAVDGVDGGRVLDSAATLDALPQASMMRLRPACVETSARKDTVITSWVDQGTYGIDWGMAFGGVRCERLRVPPGDMGQSGMALLAPRGQPNPAGCDDTEGFELYLALEKDQMDLLLADSDFMQYVKLLSV